jgi:ankyrin repeat protein
MARALLGASCDVNTVNRERQTALMLAARNGHKALVKLLLGVEGVQVTARDDSDRTAQDHASTKAIFNILYVSV